MQKSARAALVVITSIVATIGLWLASAFTAALAFGAIALIVPGTGTHNINPPNAVEGYKENAADRYINPSGVACTSTNGCELLGVDYPASFWPIPLPGWCPGLTCDTWNESVGEGVTNLNSQLAGILNDEANDDEQIIVFGYSQGGAVVSRAMYDIAKLDEATRDRITVVTIGNINNPQGLWSRLSFLRYIPILNVSFGPQLPTDIGVKSTNYSFEYDPVGDAPQYWGNPLAMLNALFAFEYVHGYYLDPTSNGPTDSMPYGYDDASLAAAIAAAPKRVHGNATFVLIPQRGTLPIFMPLVDLGNATGTSAFVDPVVRLLQPVTKLLIDLGYDRNADPGVPRNLSILPFNPFTLNPVQFSADFVEAIIQGIEDAFRGSSMIAVPVPTPSEAESDEPSVLASFNRLAAEPTEDEAPADSQPTAPTTGTAPTDKGETSEGDATVTPLPVEPQESVDPAAGDAVISDDDAAKDEELENDDVVTDNDGGNLEEDASQEETEEVTDDETTVTDNDNEADVKDSTEVDRADAESEKAAA
ncbi:PE-PPE domain-containing protein [Mycolicibacterium litorale]|uniref:PE-PPE domain-containing protein n=2 Tax=Mycolicibacterium litorale TaxID=758802 RepID=A0AAD1MVW9_9MYCO|nr:PE-PPE domain-containing protein [Mycolicibacterium litorale]MCV7416413.1 PE-PPE domain-containing protein [Mycolicibacterium litorale]TDY09667.1 PE-PPE domain-containing protein [Mycolicibacterium litorale]BBY17611.1 PE-PPE domain-containing protein [Mycolicibacterium litorale]